MWFVTYIERSIRALVRSVASRWLGQQSPTFKHLAVQARHRAETGSLPSPVQQFRERRLQLELLLWEVRAAAKALTIALDDETRSGLRAVALDGEFKKVGRADREFASALAEWQGYRHEVERAQAAYCRASNAYREFVQYLPPHLRTKAEERGARAMAISPA